MQIKSSGLVLYSVTNNTLARTGSGTGTQSANHVVPIGEVWVCRISGHRHLLGGNSGITPTMTITSTISDGTNSVNSVIAAAATSTFGATGTLAYPGYANVTSTSQWSHNDEEQFPSLRVNGGLTITVTTGMTAASSTNASASANISYVLEKYRWSA